MLESKFLTEIYTTSYNALKNNVNSITHSQSLQQPSWGGNCLNWIVGHIVIARLNFLTLLEIESVWGWNEIRLYIPGSSPIAENSPALNFEKMVADLDLTQTQLLEALSKSTPAVLNRQVEDDSQQMTLGALLAHYCLHENFHVGQTEILRQFLINPTR
jgi:uncharacterized damage-inducible protein DinB